MKVALCSTMVPFVAGGARFIVEWLEERLRERGHEVDRIYLPFDEDPAALLGQMTAFRLMAVADEADRLICFRPPSYLLRHPRKTVWFIHHLRGFYDLWGGPYAHLPDEPRSRALRECVRTADSVGLQEARSLFTNSRIVGDRLRRFNGIESEVLYPPIQNPQQFRCDGYGDEIVYVCRIERHKRQHLLIEAMKHVRTPVRLRICGASGDDVYFAELTRAISSRGLESKVRLENRWISEEEKIGLLSRALAVAYVAFDEDSYGYPSLEASHSEKAILTTTDAGGVLELVTDGVNGAVCSPEPIALAAAMDQLFEDRDRTTKLGQAARQRLHDLNISWDHVMNRLLS